MEERPTDLYRHFDKDGRLLYVGISFRAIVRQAAHSNAAPWWDDVATITVERFETRKAAKSAERRAIETEKPLHNKHWAEKRFKYRSKKKHGFTMELPGAADMAQAVVDWYISLTRNQRMPKDLVGLADKFDQSTDAGRGHALAIKALEQLHKDMEIEKHAERKAEKSSTAEHKAVLRKLGARPGPANLVQRLEKEDPKKLRALRKDLADPLMTWRKLHKKYGYAVATLRRHFEEERKQALLNLAADDEK